MTDREKFIQVIKHSLSGWLNCHIIRKIAPMIADGLIAEGAIMLLCKAGDNIWFLNDSHYAIVEAVRITKRAVYYEWTSYEYGPEETEVWDSGEFTVASIGKTVFLTKEAAEAARKLLAN